MSTKSFIVNGLHTSVISPRDSGKGYILFVHGGPGNHSAYFQRLVEQENDYTDSGLGWIFYDQRGCGRSGLSDSDLSHDGNIEDLSALLDHFALQGMTIKAVFGHSYGAWLAYDVFHRRQDLGPIGLIMAGRSVHKTLTRHRLAAVDLLLLKMHQPHDYEEVLSAIVESNQPAAAHSEMIRSRLHDVGPRKHFYWANLSRMKAYQRVIEDVAIPENNDVYWRVRRTLYNKNSTGSFDPTCLSCRILWINGSQDFVMGGETQFPEQEKCVQTFLGSAHYPHIEEPVRFMREVDRFLGVED